MIALIGSIIVCACVLGGFMMSGGNLLLLWHPIEIVVIGGAALGAFITSNPIKVVKASVSGAIGLFKKPSYDRAAYVDLLKLIYDLLVKSRKEGLLAIEADIEDPAKSSVFSKYPAVLADHHMLEFITDCLRLMVGGNLDPQELESLLEYELETHHKEAHEPSHAVQGVADALPGFGIVAAVLGIVNTMGIARGRGYWRRSARRSAPLSSEHSSASWSHMDSSGPIASAMEHKARTRKPRPSKWSRWRLVASVRGYRAAGGRRGSRASCCSAKCDPTFADLEAHLKGKPPAANPRKAAEAKPTMAAATPKKARPKPALSTSSASRRWRRRPPRRRVESGVRGLRDRDDGVLHGDVADHGRVEGTARSDLRLLQEPEHGRRQGAEACSRADGPRRREHEPDQSARRPRRTTHERQRDTRCRRARGTARRTRRCRCRDEARRRGPRKSSSNR